MTVPPDAEHGQTGKVHDAVVEGVTLPGATCPAVQVYVSTTTPSGRPSDGMITITQAAPCNPAALGAFVDVLMGMVK